MKKLTFKPQVEALEDRVALSCTGDASGGFLDEAVAPTIGMEEFFRWAGISPCSRQTVWFGGHYTTVVDGHIVFP